MEITSRLLVANWKMNPRTRAEAKELILAVKKQARVPSGVEVVIAPPHVYLDEVEKVIRGKFSLGAQAVSGEKMGAFTGSVSAGMLQSVGVTYCIVGHSERRAQGETDSEVEKQLTSLLKSGITPILCVGERERDTHGKYFGVVEAQLRSALRVFPGSRLAQLVIAYEPIWAISTATPGARVATPDDAHEMIIFIRKILTDLFGRTQAGKVRILYGGSVDQKNSTALLAHSGAQGFLVGGASLRPSDFVTILKTLHAR